MPILLLPYHRDPRTRPPAVYSPFRFDAAEFPELPRASRPKTSSLALHSMRASSYAQSLGCPVKMMLSASEAGKVPESSIPQEARHLASFKAPKTVNSDIAVAPPSFSRFLELPIELRENVWELAIRGTSNAGHRSKGNNGGYLTTSVEIRDHRESTMNISCPSFLPSVCRVSKLTMSETIGVFVRSSKFLVASFKDNCFLDSFLQKMPKGYDATRSIHFAFFDCFPNGFPQNSDLELAVRCTGLHTIKMTFHSTRLFVWVLLGDYDDGLTSCPRPVDEMWSHYKLDRLMDCVNLQNVIIERKGRAVDAALESSEDLGKRIEKEYAQKHRRNLNVTFSYH